MNIDTLFFIFGGLAEANSYGKSKLKAGVNEKSRNCPVGDYWQTKPNMIYHFLTTVSKMRQYRIPPLLLASHIFLSRGFSGALYDAKKGRVFVATAIALGL